MITWTITKLLHGTLEGIIVSDTLTQDASLPTPFRPGQRVSGYGCPYTVLEVSR